MQNACDSLQGYLYSKPVSVEELKALQEVSYDISTAATSIAN
jgi:EAL domain-containing protein (putative c-di-GMP-specific phosphodiesterase class I)